MASDGLCFVFVCQAGPLETKSLLLAASLRRHLSPDHDLVAAVPQPEERWGRVSPDTLAALHRHSVRVAPIVNRVAPDYPIGNKVDCLAVPTDRAKVVFIDTDMLVLRDADFASLRDVAIGAVPASFAPFPAEIWERCYRACDLSAPVASMRTLVSDEPTPPYFNSGFVLVDRDHGAALAEAWADCARRVLALDDLPAALRDRFLDQVTLPIAAARLGTAITPLPPEWNFPSWSRTIDQGPVPAFFHYQDVPRLMREPVTQEALFALIEADGGVAQAIYAAVKAAE